MVRVRAGAGLVARYGLAGVINTLVSLAVITALDLGLHAPPALANAAGYAVGIVVSYALNRRFVFRSQTPTRASGPRFVVVTAAGFLLNQAVLHLALRALGPGPWSHEAAQIIAMASYTVSVFVACRLWVFPRGPAVGPAP